MDQDTFYATPFESWDFDLYGMSYDLFTKDCPNWDSQG